jgi:hypothetical protein
MFFHHCASEEIRGCPGFRRTREVTARALPNLTLPPFTIYTADAARGCWQPRRQVRQRMPITTTAPISAATIIGSVTST